MEIILLLLGALIGGFISWGITHKYYEKASIDNERQNDHLSKKIKKLERLVKEIPEIITENISRYTQDNENPDSDEIISDDSMSHASYKDINNDGIDELIIQFPVANHGYALQVYSIQDGSVKLIAEHGTDTPIEFDFEDIDNDGQIELRSIETNISSGKPYIAGIRDVVWYKLTNGEFIEIKREEPSKEEIEEQLSDE